MELVIKGGKIITAEREFRADIGIKYGKIAAIGKLEKRAAPNIVNASGMLVLPGVIDAHTHFQLPAGGTVTAEDFSSGTRAAACGGVTTVIDFAIQHKGQTLAETVRARREEADGKVAIDYSLHVTPTDWTERTIRELSQLSRRGFPSFKLYMTYGKQGLKSDDVAMFRALEETSKFSGLITVHAESPDVLDMLIERYLKPELMKKFGAWCHVLSRPNYIEAEAIQRAIVWAKATGGRLYIVHMSTAEGTQIVQAAQKEGVRVMAETCPHYLVLDDSVFKRPNGHRFATCPQIKKKADSERLWQGIAEGTISVIATDNCTFTKRQKDQWGGDFTKIPYGVPGSELLLPLTHTFGVVKKRLSLRRMVAVLAANPAKIFGLYPRKGTITVGADADLVVFDPQKKVIINHDNLQTACDWSPYEGIKLLGYPVMTISRGKIVVREDKFVGAEGRGRLIKRIRP